MRRPTLLVVLAAAAFAAVAAFAQAPAASMERDSSGPTGRDSSGPMERDSSGPMEREGFSRATDGDVDYTGSAACQRCHEPEYETWKSALHVQMTKPIADARIAGDFSAGTRLKVAARAYEMETRDGRYFISIAKGGRAAEKFEINYTLGARRFQGYLSKLADGRIYVLPVFWHNESKRWVDYQEITPIPEDPQHDLRQIWNVTCVNCHATNLVRNYRPATNSFATTWTEMGIGCEACHGPGRGHIDDPEHLKIFTMKKVPPRQIFDTCGYCHGNKNNVFFGFKAGDRYEDFALPFLISQPIPDNDPQGDFWPDGRPSRFNRPQALTLTGCFMRGQATCTSCHRMHGPQNDHALKVAIEAPGGGHTLQSDTLCTQCHSGAGGAGRAGAAGRAGEAGGSGRVDDDRSAKALAERASSHTHHAPESQGSRCINCHMSDVNWRLITRRLDHTFQPPVPEMTAAYGVPNACTTCHEDKSPEWATGLMDTWYGNVDRRKAVVAMSDAIYRAGTGDVAVLPEMARLAIDRSRGALIRASAAEFAGQLIGSLGSVGSPGSQGLGSPGSQGLGSPGSQGLGSQGSSISTAIVNNLIGASADPEPMVRTTAVRTLGLIHDPRVPSAVAAHLTDPARLVRVSAAEALLNLGVTTIDGPAGVALGRAQDEWTESLRTFADDTNDRTTLGWLESARGRADSAASELNAAVKLDPANARARVYLGVLAARAGRFDQALHHFKAAKSVSPNYPNLDRLIDEAQKRR